jgi:hypothetical protein
LLPPPRLPLLHEDSFEVAVSANGQEIDRQKFAVSVAGAGGSG